MPKPEKQKAMNIAEGKLELVDVKQEREIIENITFATIQMRVKIRDSKLEEIKNKIKKEKSTEKKHLLADKFIQNGLKLNKDMVLTEGDYDENWQRLKKKVFGEALDQ